MATNTPTGRKSSGASDASLPEITHHVEAPEFGGQRYARCTGCGHENVNGADSILHTDECPRSDRDSQNNTDTTPRRSEPADFGYGESTGVQDL